MATTLAASARTSRRWKREGRRVRIARPPRGWTSTTCRGRAPGIEEGCDERDHTNETENLIATAIDGRGPWDPLEGRETASIRRALVPEVLEGSCVEEKDRTAFEVRAQLKKAGCRVRAPDEATGEEYGPGGGT